MKNKILLACLFSALALIWPTPSFAQTMPAGADPKLWAEALKIHKKAIVIDGHNDITGPMVDDDFGLAEDATNQPEISPGRYHTDIKRLKAGGMTGEFMAIYVGGGTWKENRAMVRAMDLIDATYREAEKNPGDLTMCTTAAEIRRAKKQNKICLLMGIEGGYAIEDSLYALRNFYRLGIRYMTLTHNVTHAWADAHNGEKKHNGLSPFGEEVVKEMNRLGMLVDISHVSVDVMNDVLDITKAPVIASHSSARGISNHTRNVPDEVLTRVAKNGGVIMINFYPSFLDERTNREENEMSAKLRETVGKLREQYKDDRPGFNKAIKAMSDANPFYIADYKRIVDHIDHIKKIAGIDYVGLGSDYDGIPFLPPPMQGVEDLPQVTYEMLRRGYSEADIRKVLGLNFLRAFEAAEKVAGSRQISGQGSLQKLKK